ncbi:MAG: MlaD family protein [Prochloraceae cyanobacterium]
MLRSRSIREGSVGLLIIVGLFLFGGLVFWLRNGQLGRSSYKIKIRFPDAYGLQVGSNVRYRGVEVGQITNLKARSNYVEVTAEISPATLPITRDIEITTNRSGFIGQTFVDIIPQSELSTDAVSFSPLRSNCQSTQTIVCEGDTLNGESGVSFEQLLPSTLRLTELYSSPEFYENLNGAIANVSVTAAEVTKLSGELVKLSDNLNRQLADFSVKTSDLVVTADRTANNINRLATDLDKLVVDNRATISRTLTSFNNTSDRLNDLIVTLNPAVEQLNSGLAATNTKQLFQNIEILTANGAETFANLRSFTGAFSNESNILILQETLDSARVTFANTQKLTSDLDELIGDPDLRKNLRDLIDGLGNLVSFTDELDREIKAAQMAKIQNNSYIKNTKPNFSFDKQKLTEFDE